MSKKRFGIGGLVLAVVVGGAVTADKLQPDKPLADNIWTSWDANTSFAGGLTQDVPAVKTNIIDPAVDALRQTNVLSPLLGPQAGTGGEAPASGGDSAGVQTNPGGGR